MATVLIIDDSDVIRRTASAVLSNNGYTVYEAADGASGREQAFLIQPDLILLDILLPDANGIDLAMEFSELPTVLVAVTSLSDPDDLQQIMNAGCHTILQKPVPPPTLLDAVQSILAG